MPEQAVPLLYSSRYWSDYTRAIGHPTLEERLRFDHANGLGKLRRDVLPFRRSGRLIDVGASSGGLVRQALDLGFDAVGLEPAADICDLARRSHGVTMHCGTLEQQAFADASFEIVTLHDVLEHLFEPLRDLCEMRRILAPGGLLVVETPTTSSAYLAEAGEACTFLSPLEHVHLFSEANGARLIERAGFRLLDLYCPHEDNWIAIAEAA
jgi:2-polyprenyl-3-methyl-5-hydroxy-6-metoxy-1,4-benzoquinol methylase